MTEEQFKILLQELKDRFDGIDARFDNIDARFDGVDARFDSIDTRFEGVDARFDSIDARFEGVDARFDSIDTRFEGVDGQFEGIYSRLDRLEEGQKALREDHETLKNATGEILKFISKENRECKKDRKNIHTDLNNIKTVLGLS